MFWLKASGAFDQKWVKPYKEKNKTAFRNISILLRALISNTLSWSTTFITEIMLNLRHVLISCIAGCRYAVVLAHAKKCQRKQEIFSRFRIIYSCLEYCQQKLFFTNNSIGPSAQFFCVLYV